MPSPKVVVDEVLTLAQTEDAAARGEALARLPRAGWQTVFPLIAAVRADDAAVRQMAADGLAVVAGAAEGEEYVEPLLKRAIPVLTAALTEDGSPAVRAAVATALKAVDGYYGREEMTINFADPYIRGRVRKMDGPLAAAAADDPDAAVRAAAAAAVPTGEPAPTRPARQKPERQQSPNGKRKSLWQLFRKS